MACSHQPTKPPTEVAFLHPTKEANMCNCRADIENKLTEHYAQKLAGSKDVEANLTGYAITLGGSLRIRAFMPAEIRHTVTTKSTGKERRKTEKINMFFSHCPFCGTPLEEKKVQTATH
jgi:hypothetical protein